MSEPCRVYKLPIITEETTGPTESEKAFDELRRQAGLPEKYPPPWYKRIARFYDENWEYIFEGVGPAIIFLAVFSIMALIIVNLGRATGWWGGVM